MMRGLRGGRLKLMSAIGVLAVAIAAFIVQRQWRHDMDQVALFVGDLRNEFVGRADSLGRVGAARGPLLLDSRTIGRVTAFAETRGVGTPAVGRTYLAVLTDSSSDRAGLDRGFEARFVDGGRDRGDSVTINLVASRGALRGDAVTRDRLLILPVGVTVSLR